MKYLLLLFSLSVLAQGQYSKQYAIEFTAFVHTDLEDDKHAILRQVNHSLGPSTQLLKLGYRSSLSHRFTYEILNTVQLNAKERRIEYKYKGFLTTESYVNPENYKVTMPIQPLKAFKRSNGRCSDGYILGLFYQSWSPRYKRCKLIKGKDYESFKLASFRKVDSSISHATQEFLHNGEYNLFYYFGSDFYSLKRMGEAGKSARATLRYLKKNGFRKRNDLKIKKDIFSNTRLYSQFNYLQGYINGTRTNVYILAGNPTNTTPGAKKEFFYFFKYAFKNASAITYSGHAGLGAILDFDTHEKKYGEKIDYGTNHKQLFFFSGCSTYIQSSGFYFNKIQKPNSLVLMTNGLTIYTSINKDSVYTIADTFFAGTSFSNQDLINKSLYWMKKSGARGKDFAMPIAESN